MKIWQIASSCWKIIFHANSRIGLIRQWHGVNSLLSTLTSPKARRNMTWWGISFFDINLNAYADIRFVDKILGWIKGNIFQGKKLYYSDSPEKCCGCKPIVSARASKVCKKHVPVAKVIRLHLIKDRLFNIRNFLLSLESYTVTQNLTIKNWNQIRVSNW